MNQPLPLFVDLDGTLIKEDIGQLSLKDQIKKNFFICFVVIFKFIFLVSQMLSSMYQKII